MKKISAPLLAVLVLAISLTSCKKFFDKKTPKVDAGDNIVTMLPEDSVWLSGSATDKDGEIESYQWLKIDGPQACVIQQPDSPSTWVKNLEEGVYKFKLIATDNDHIFGSDTVTVTVLPRTLSVQPENNHGEAHLFGNGDDVNQVDVDAPEIAGGSGTYFGSPVVVRALLKFDLSSIPDSAEITGAKLFLYSHPDPLNGNDEYPNYGTQNELLIQRVSEPWERETLTFQNQPSGTAEGQIEIPQTNEHFLDLEVDVKDLITDMRSEGNNGFLIKLKNETPYNWRIFVSSKNTTYADKHPKLEVTYKLN